MCVLEATLCVSAQNLVCASPPSPILFTRCLLLEDLIGISTSIIFLSWMVGTSISCISRATSPTTVNLQRHGEKGASCRTVIQTYYCSTMAAPYTLSGPSSLLSPKNPLPPSELGPSHPRSDTDILPSLNRVPDLAHY